jgi:hypothetical protein
LIDIALEIPGEMENFDNEPIHGVSDLSERLRNLVRIRGDLDSWQKYVEHTCPTTIESQIELIDNQLTGFSQDFVFDDTEIASAFTFYAGVRLGLLELCLQVAQGLAQSDGMYQGLVQKLVSETLTWCTVASQCLNFFYHRHDVSGKLLCFFPFEMAWKMIRKVSNEFGLNVHDHEHWFHEIAEAFNQIGLPVMMNR